MTISSISKSGFKGEQNKSLAEANKTRPMDIEYLIQAGGGAGGSGRLGTTLYTGEYQNGGGGAAGGMNSNVIGDNTGGGTANGGTTPENPFGVFLGYNYRVAVGAGGAARTSAEYGGPRGNSSYFGDNVATYGGGGGGRNGSSTGGGCNGGVGGGIYGGVNEGIYGEGRGGGYSVVGGPNNATFGAGGGTSTKGGNTNSNDSDNDPAGTGGTGTITTIITAAEATANSVGEVSGSDVYFGGGGGGGNNGPKGTGGGGGGGGAGGRNSGAGGSGVVILRYPKQYSINTGASHVSTTITQGDKKVTIFTAGDDDVSFSL